MNELKINYEVGHPTVSARELHEGLEITERFSSWFDRMARYGFYENEDFTGCKVFNTLAKQELKDYMVSIDMAKQICMLQRSDKGKQYRQYFLDLEKAWNTPEQIMARALKMADKKIGSLINKNHLLEADVNRMKPKEIFADALSISKNSILIGELAKLLKQNGIDIGQNRLFEWLRSNGYLIKRKGTDYNMPQQRSMEMGLFEIKETCITHSDGHTSINKTSKVTGKGQCYFVNKFVGGSVEVNM